MKVLGSRPVFRATAWYKKEFIWYGNKKQYSKGNALFKEKWFG